MKKFIALLLAAVLLLAGCSSPVVRTVVLKSEETELENDITVAKASNLVGVTARYIGFDEQGRLFGVRNSGRLFYWDADFETCEYVDTPGTVVNADVAAQGSYIMAETLDAGGYTVLLYPAEDLNSPIEIGSYSENTRTAPPRWSGGAAYACFVTKSMSGYVLNTYDGFETYSMRVNDNMTTGYQNANMIRGYILEDAFYIGSDWLVIKVTFNLGTYYAVAELADGEIADVMILESSGGTAVPTYSGMYYIDKQSTLVFYDAMSKVNVEHAREVKCFDVAASAELAVYVEREGSAEKLYIMHTNGSDKTLVDINNGIASLDLSEDGTRLLVRYEDPIIPPAVYMLEY